MATVYAATHRNGNRVAIKLLRSSLAHDAEVRARFLREGYVSNAVGHAGSVKVLDDGTLDGSPFLVMELLEGESLEARRTRLGGRLSVEEVVPIADSLLDILASAHRRGIVHRDVKPENVFLTHEGEIKVLDFGIAQMRRAGVDKTGVGLVLGTPDFMAPEQMIGEPDEIDGRSDLWSTGATLFFLLSGQPTHQATTLRSQIIARLTKQARSLGVVAPWVPRPLVDVIDRALQLEKAERWPDADTMRAALHRTYRLPLAGSDAAASSAASARLPDLGADDHGEDPTQFQASRPWFAQLAATLAPPAGPTDLEDRTMARPAPSSERTIGRPLYPSSERTIAMPAHAARLHAPAYPPSVRTLAMPSPASSERSLPPQRTVSGVRSSSVEAEDIDIELTELMVSSGAQASGPWGGRPLPPEAKRLAPPNDAAAASDLRRDARQASHRRLRDLALLFFAAMVFTCAVGLVYERLLAR